MEYKEYNCHSYNIHTIKTDKFKTCVIEIIFRNDIKDPQKRSLLLETMHESTQKYKQSRLMKLELLRLYNTSFNIDNARVGKSLVSAFTYDFINPKYCDSNMIKDLFSLINETIFHPNVNNNIFDERAFNISKSILKDCIRSIKEDPVVLTGYNALKSMDKDSVSAISMVGTEESLELITPKDLYEEYLNMLEHDYCDIFILGDLDMDLMVQEIKKFFKLPSIKNHEIGLKVNNKVRKKYQSVEETGDYVQGNLLMIYNLDNLTKKEEDTVIRIYNYILGGGSGDSLLFNNLREKKSLCYRTSSHYQKYDGLLFVSAGIDSDTKEEAIKEVNNCINVIRKSKVPEQSLVNAKNAIIEQIKLSYDGKAGIMNNIQMEVFNNIKNKNDIELKIKEIDSVTMDDVIEVSKKVKLNTAYFLKGIKK